MKRLTQIACLLCLCSATTLAGANSLTSGSGLGSFSLAPSRSSGGHHSKHSIDGIAAVVNNGVILKSRLNQAVAQARQQGNRNIPRNVLRSRVLDRLIMRKLELQQAHREGITISKSELAQGIQRLAKSNNMSVAQFKQAAQQHHLTLKSLKKQIRKQMLIAKVRRQNVMSQVSITPDDVNQYLHTQDLQNGVKNKYRFRRIIEKPTSGNGTKRKELENLRQRAKNGANFATLARKNSSGPNAAHGGLVNWTPASQLSQPIAKALGNLSQGGISNVIHQGNRLILLKLLGRRPIGGSHSGNTVTQVKVRHIVIDTNAIRNRKKAKALADRLRHEIKAGDSFASVAKQYSDDKSTASDGGELGWITVNQINPKTRRVISNLNPGQVSPVLKAAKGFEIIKLQKRRTQNQARQKRRNKARQALGQKQAQERGKIWMHKLRDQAYIDIRIKNYQPQAGFSIGQ